MEEKRAVGRVMTAKSITIHVCEDVMIKSDPSHAIYGSLNEVFLGLNTWYPSS